MTLIRLLFILFAFLWIQNLFAQNQSIVFVQSELTDLELSSEAENSSALIFRGDPISDSFKYFIRHVEGTRNKFVFELPNAIVNQEQFKEGRLEQKDEIISEIKMQKQENKEKALFTLTFTIETTSPAIAKVRRYNEQQIEISFVSIDVPGGTLPVPEFEDGNSESQFKFNADGTPFFNVDNFKPAKAEPGALYVSIINAGSKIKTSAQLAIYLNNVLKSKINKRIGMQLNIFQVSEDVKIKLKQTTIYFRKNFIKPAMILADVIPGNQKIKRMFHEDAKQGIHIEIYLGKDFK